MCGVGKLSGHIGTSKNVKHEAMHTFVWSAYGILLLGDRQAINHYHAGFEDSWFKLCCT